MAKKVWAVTQLREGSLHPMSKETLAAGQRLAAATDCEVEAAVLGSGVAEVAEELSRLRLAAVRVADHANLAAYTPGAYVGLLEAAIRDAAPDVVLFPHTYQSVDYVPRLAQALGAALIAEAVSFNQVDGELRWQRPIFGGKLFSEVRVRGEGPVLATVQSGAFSADELETGTAPIEELAVEGASVTLDRELLGTEEVAGEHVDLSQAEIIVAVGRGIGSEDKMQIVEELATALGAEIGASRPVVDSGWLDRDRQIGSSGQTVAPKLYLAVGISGAIQHLVGMKGSQVVVAINKDSSAPIFGVADYGVIGDLHEILPALTETIIDAKGA
jgi:electron transfer flavoprotein alpha subunit